MWHNRIYEEKMSQVRYNWLELESIIP